MSQHQENVFYAVKMACMKCRTSYSEQCFVLFCPEQLSLKIISFLTCFGVSFQVVGEKAGNFTRSTFDNGVILYIRT